jgi:ABC-type sugar transport system substrate-binding protein
MKMRIIRSFLVAVLLSVDIAFATQSSLRRKLSFLAAGDTPCTTCLNRRSKTIKAFYHGHRNDPFWRPIVAAAGQAGEEHGVAFTTKLYDSMDNSAQMAADIRSAVQRRLSDPVDAMILSIPSEQVRDAAWEATMAGIPVFGMNCGANNEFETTLEMGGFVGQDEYQAGREAAKRFLEAREDVNKAVFINHDSESRAMQKRFMGFRDGIQAANPESIVVDVEVDVSTPFAKFNIERNLKPFLGACDTDLVLSGGAWPARPAMEVVQKWNTDCNSTQPTLFAAFDTDGDIISAISTGHVLFAVSQQSYLQAVVPVTLASLFVTTGKIIDNESTMLSTGPIIIDANNNLPDIQHQICVDKGFVDTSCIRREEIRIGVVMGAHTNKLSAWNTLVGTAELAVNDLGVFFGLYEASGDVVAKIRSICEETIVDGLLLSVDSASSDLAEAVEYCESRNIHVVGAVSDPNQIDTFNISVGAFSPDIADMPSTYFQGYLATALLAYLAESKQRFQSGSRLQPTSETSLTSLMSLSCSANSFQICDSDGYDTVPNDVLDRSGTSSPQVPPAGTIIDVVKFRSITDWILLVVFVVMGLLILGAITYFVSVLMTRVINSLQRDEPQDDVTVSIYNEEEEDDDDLKCDTRTMTSSDSSRSSSHQSEA